MRIYDISEAIAPATAVFPGDNGYSSEWIMRLADGASCNVSTMRMSVHCGTHADAPLHYDESGSDAASLDLSTYLGPCRVIDAASAGSPPLVDPACLDSAALTGVERVLLRTRAEHDATEFDPEFTALGAAAARSLVDAGVRLVGIDTPSMDHSASTDLSAHRVLATGGLCLLENLDLTSVPAGDYELIALPLKIVGGDAAPVRAVLRELPRS